MRAHPLRDITILFTILVVIFPIFPLLIWSVAGKWMYPDLLPSEYSFDNFIIYFNVYSMGDLIRNSIIVSLIVTAVSLMMGIVPAKFIGTNNFKGKTLVQTLTMLPVLGPALTVLMGLMGVFIQLDIYRTVLSVIICEVIFLTPYAVMVLVPIFKNYDKDIEQQAATLGINGLSSLLNIILPSIRTGLAVCAMYVFMSSWATYLAVSMFAPSGFDTVATMLYPAIAYGQYSYSMMAALTVLFFIPSVIFLFISTWIMGTDKINNQRV